MIRLVRNFSRITILYQLPFDTNFHVLSTMNYTPFDKAYFFFLKKIKQTISGKKKTNKCIFCLNNKYFR